MHKKKKIDFILNQREGEKLIFRFYPKQSNCHSFGDEPAKSREDVYKVYFSYAILKQYEWPIKSNKWSTQVLFACHCDECSVLDQIAYARISCWKN